MSHRKTRVSGASSLAFIVLGFLAQDALPATAQATGTLTGSIISEDGLPVSGTRLVYREVMEPLTPATKYAKPRFANPRAGGAVNASADGRYRIENLPTGRYSVCAIGSQRGHISSCLWEEGQHPVIDVRAGAVGTAPALVIRNGRILNIRVLDPNGRIAAAGPRSFGVGVLTDTAHFKGADVVRWGSTDLELEVVVPRGRTVRLQLACSFAIDVADERGQPMPVGVPSQQIMAGSQAQVNIVLFVR